MSLIYTFQIGLYVAPGEAQTTKASTNLPQCFSPGQQILRHMYVDYFKSPGGPCVTPEGEIVHTYKSKGDKRHQGDLLDDPEVKNSLCTTLPHICHLLQDRRG